MKKNNQLYKQLFDLYPKAISELSDYGICILDENGTIQTWNNGLEILTLYKSEEMIGRHYENLFPDFLREKNVPSIDLNKANKTGKSESENWIRKKNEKVLLANCTLSKIALESDDFIGYLAILQDITERKNFEDQLKKKNEELKKNNPDLSRFIYKAVHDLKAPINNIEGLILTVNDELKDEVKTNPAIAEMMGLILSSIEKFRITISELVKSTKAKTD